MEINEIKNTRQCPVKTESISKDIKWRFEGNKQQYVFNSEIEESIKQCMWALQNQKYDYAQENCSDILQKIHVRNKHIRIGDSSEGGWETVRQYQTNPLASDSDDESRIKVVHYQLPGPI